MNYFYDKSILIFFFLFGLMTRYKIKKISISLMQEPTIIAPSLSVALLFWLLFGTSSSFSFFSLGAKTVKIDEIGLLLCTAIIMFVFLE